MRLKRIFGVLVVGYACLVGINGIAQDHGGGGEAPSGSVPSGACEGDCGIPPDPAPPVDPVDPAPEPITEVVQPIPPEVKQSTGSNCGNTCDKGCDNLCTKYGPWYNIQNCISYQQIWGVTWYNACPLGKYVQRQPKDVISFYALYKGPKPGVNYAGPEIRLACTMNQVASLPPSLAGAASVDFSTPTGQPTDTLHNCNPDGSVAVRPHGEGEASGYNQSCNRITPMTGGVNYEITCAPVGCNKATLAGCDMPIGVYEFHIKNEALGVGPSNGQCDPRIHCPPCEMSSDLYCPNGGQGSCYKQHQICTYGGNKPRYEVIQHVNNKLPDELAFVAYFAAEKARINGDEIQYHMVNDFSKSLAGETILKGQYGAVNYVPAANGVLFFSPSMGTKDITIGSIEVKSLECPKESDGITPIQSVPLGSPDSCTKVQTTGKKTINVNVFKQGQTNFGVAHAISTAVNQLMEPPADDKPKAEVITPILTVGITEPVKNCLTSALPDGDPNRNIWSHYEQSATKWCPYDNRQGSVNGQNRMTSVECGNSTFVADYKTALKNAAKRLKDQGGTVVAVALSCKGTLFEAALADISSGGMDLRNFAPQGVYLGGCLQQAGALEGENPANGFASNVYHVDVDALDNLVFRPAVAQGSEQPLYGNIGDVYAEVVWARARNYMGQEICANQAEGQCAGELVATAP